MLFMLSIHFLVTTVFYRISFVTPCHKNNTIKKRVNALEKQISVKIHFIRAFNLNLGEGVFVIY